MNLPKDKLHELIQNKLARAGLSQQHASVVADVLAHADARGVHSHGAMRVEYYAERIAKGGTNTNPQFTYKKTGESTAVFDGDNGAGHVAAKEAMMKRLHWPRRQAPPLSAFAESGTAALYLTSCSRLQKKD